MTAFPWKESFSVHFEPMDLQHRKIFDYMSAIHEAIESRLSEDELDEMLDRFDIYCKMHFFEEERLMEEVGFPDITDHRRQHDLFVLHLERFRMERDKNHTEESSAAFTAIIEWFVRHILSLDKLYGAYIEKQAVIGD